MSQPEVHFVAPRSNQAVVPCSGTGEGAGCCPKSGSFFNYNKVCISSKVVGGVLAAVAPQAVTSVVPAFATATIPIALQTTRFVSGAELGLVSGGAGVAGRETGTELSRAEIADIVRDAVRKESARRETAPQRPEAAPQGDACSDLKSRVDGIEKRLGQIEKQVGSIEEKLKQVH